MEDTALSEQLARAMVEEAVRKYRFLPLPMRVRSEYLKAYREGMNGFDQRKEARINGVAICSDYTRVVVGDYGAYLEFTPEQLLVELVVTPGQEWRTDAEYIAKRGLNVKYVWLEYQGVKVYFQLGTVNYADYLINHYYVSVLELD